jgi:hypothetical protein
VEQLFPREQLPEINANWQGRVLPAGTTRGSKNTTINYAARSANEIITRAVITITHITSLGADFTQSVSQRVSTGVMTFA